MQKPPPIPEAALFIPVIKDFRFSSPKTSKKTKTPPKDGA
jgi:hypothetical protein